MRLFRDGQTLRDVRCFNRYSISSGIVRPEAKESDSTVRFFGLSPDMLRFHQILRPNESFHTFPLFLPVNLSHRYYIININLYFFVGYWQAICYNFHGRRSFPTHRFIVKRNGRRRIDVRFTSKNDPFNRTDSGSGRSLSPAHDVGQNGGNHNGRRAFYFDFSRQR